MKFKNFCRSAEQKFLSADTFTDYKKSFESRMKFIEEKLGLGVCLLAIIFYEQKRDKGYRSILSGLKSLKGIEIEVFFPL